MTKVICVIGAGISGLPSIKACVEEGLDVVCYERTDDIGGLWNYREYLGQNQSTVMKSTIVNTSKEMMCYSDFPAPEEYPNFMHNTLVNQYLSDYAAHFRLNDHIQFNVEVISVRKAADFVESGKWLVRTRRDGGAETERSFDGVMICSGHHMTPSGASFDGQTAFEGDVIHSQTYRHPGGFEDKRVLLVGIGNSALDAAIELCRVAKKLYLSTRRGTWLWNRVSKRGWPYDVWYFRRYLAWLQLHLPNCIAQSYFEHMVNERFDHQMYGLKPQHRFFAQHPAVNDSLPNALLSGQVVLKKDLHKFTGSKWVQFVDGSTEEVDVVMLCTGYNIGFSFLEPQALIPVNENRVNLYKFVFPPDLERNSLAVIGLIQPYGSIQPISELQARWVARVFSGEARLPSPAEMNAEIKKTNEANAARYHPSQRHTVQVDYVVYADEIASFIGASPLSWRLLFSDPKLFCAVLFGACTPATFRLVGPGAWREARRVVMGTDKRVVKPLQTRSAGYDPSRDSIASQRFWTRYWITMFVIALLFTLFAPHFPMSLIFGLVIPLTFFHIWVINFYDMAAMV